MLRHVNLFPRHSVRSVFGEMRGRASLCRFCGAAGVHGKVDHSEEGKKGRARNIVVRSGYRPSPAPATRKNLNAGDARILQMRLAVDWSSVRSGAAMERRASRQCCSASPHPATSRRPVREVLGINNPKDLGLAGRVASTIQTSRLGWAMLKRQK
jgi:hypothetical protein